MTTDNGHRAGTARWLVALLAAAAALAAAALPAAASAATSLYPDLRMLGPTDIHLGQTTENGVNHYVLRFETLTYNAGEGALELDLTPDTSGVGTLTQRVYEDPAGFHDEPVGAMTLPLLSPFAVPNLARYEVWTEREYTRAASRNFTRGRPLWTNTHGYCLSDDTAVQGNAKPAVYNCAAEMIEGITPGWATEQDQFNLNQWVDFGTAPPPDGAYVVRAVIDPDNLLFESAGKSDPAREGEVPNSGIAYFRVQGGQLLGVE